MKLKLVRFSSQQDDTLGLLYINDEFACFTLEDEFRNIKKYGETRIPEGEYHIKIRKTGGFHNRYKNKFSGMHKGMLQLQDVPGFNYVLIHIGNKDDDTAGCILVGNTAQQNIDESGFIGSSTSAYKRIYPEIAKAVEDGDEVKILIRDIYLDY